MADNIILIGFMGSGKSAVGKTLAKLYQDYTFVDSDKEIERISGRSINEIFATSGEEVFRQMERDFLSDICAGDRSIVLSTGGGMPCYRDNADILRASGYTVYLSAKPETIYERVKDDMGRPLLNVADKLGRIRELLGQRDATYRKAARLIVETDGKLPKRIAEEIMQNITRVG